MSMRFWGVRGSIPTPGPTTLYYGGNTSCIELRAGKQIIILDAGTGLRLLGRELLNEFGDEPLDLTLLLTHTHWDHIQGLPFFPPVWRPQNRLRILGFEGARLGLENVLTSQMESPFFPIGLREVPANVRIEELGETSFSLGGVQIQASRAHHPGICVGYRLTGGGGSMAFFPDNELRRNTGTSTGGERPRRVPVETDVSKAALCEFVRGVDVLVMDTQYTREEYPEHVGWGHGCLDEVVSLAMEADVKTLYLFHHDPDHDDKQISQMTDYARQLVGAANGKLQIEAAREGLVVDIGQRKS